MARNCLHPLYGQQLGLTLASLAPELLGQVDGRVVTGAPCMPRRTVQVVDNYFWVVCLPCGPILPCCLPNHPGGKSWPRLGSARHGDRWEERCGPPPSMSIWTGPRYGCWGDALTLSHTPEGRPGNLGKGVGDGFRRLTGQPISRPLRHTVTSLWRLWPSSEFLLLENRKTLGDGFRRLTG